MKASPYTIILFYKFAKIKNPSRLQNEQRELCKSLNLKGRFIIAEEGVNATLEGKTSEIKKYIRQMRTKKIFKDIVFKQSEGTGQGFSKLQVKIRPEIVTLGAGKFDIKKDTAKNITPSGLERLYKKNEDFAILDLRNNYEIIAGQFEKTVNPNLDNFRDLPKKISSLKHLKTKKIIAVCTGGIRCEKATCLLKKKGFTNLYQLKDGIHTYIQKYPNSRFKGSLFVFDNRMTTPVVDIPNREVIGKCIYCGNPSEDFYNNDSTRPSTKVICCNECFKSRKKELRHCFSPLT
jgi:UPF0176 protein